MHFGAQRVSISKIFSTALFHGHARIESPPHPSPASTLWFIKVVCTLCIRHSQSLSLFDTIYFRENLDPFVAFGVVYHIQNRLRNPDLAFRFFRHSRRSHNLIHLEPTFDFLLRSLCQMGCHDSAKIVYESMKTDGLLPGSLALDFTFLSFASAGKFRIAEEILVAKAEVCNEKEETVSSFVYNKFLSTLMDRNQINEAVDFFTDHVLRLKSLCPDTCSFNIVMRGLCRVSKVEKAFEFLDVMKGFGCHPDLVTYNTLIHGFCRVGEMDRAEALLREVKLRSGFPPDVVTYSSVISGYCKTGEMASASSLLEEMISNGIRPNLFTFNTIIDGFGKKGELTSARRMYERMFNSGLNINPDVVTFTSLIDGFCRLGELEKGMTLWDEMNERKVPPNVFTFSVLINALCKENRLIEARDLLRQLGQREDIMVVPPFVYNPVVDGFCKSGNVDEANLIIAEMEAKGCMHDKMTFTILILGHCMKGRMSEAMGVYNKMLLVGCVPDDITVGSLVGCLRKAGMANEANAIEQKALNTLVHSVSTSQERTSCVRNNVNVTVAVYS